MELDFWKRRCLKKIDIGGGCKTIFMNYLEFHNTKQEMNLEKVNNLIFLGKF